MNLVGPTAKEQPLAVLYPEIPPGTPVPVGGPSSGMFHSPRTSFARFRHPPSVNALTTSIWTRNELIPDLQSSLNSELNMPLLTRN